MCVQCWTIIGHVWLRLCAGFPFGLCAVRRALDTDGSTVGSTVLLIVTCNNSEVVRLVFNLDFVL